MHLKSTIAFGLSLAEAVTAAALGPRAICHADYCLRALRATQFPTRLPQASADCSSFMGLIGVGQQATVTVTQKITVTTSTTITLGTTTTDDITITQTNTVAAGTVTVTIPVPGGETLKKRLAGTIPAYASWCSGAARFTSACACIGVTSTGVSVPGPSTHTQTVSTTITVPATETAYTTATVINSRNATVTFTPEEVVTAVYEFKVRATAGAIIGYLSVTGPGTIDIMDDISEATSFTISTISGALMVDDMVALATGDGSTLAFVNMDNPNDVGPGYQPLVCNLGAANRLNCDFEGSMVFGELSGFLTISPSEQAAEAGGAGISIILTAFSG